MLKSIKIIPPKDLFSFIDNKYFPYSLLPNIKFIYKNKTISYDKKDIILIYSLNNSIKSLKRKLYENNELIIDFKYIINPNKIILDNNYDILINKRINKIKNILPFCNNITNLIISFLPKPNLSWKIKKKRKWGWSSKDVIFDTYSFSNNTIPFYIPKTKIYNYKTYFLKKIIYGIFKNNSDIPEEIKIINSFNYKYIPVYSNKITKIICIMNKRNYIENI
jgi:hypothetical protein